MNALSWASECVRSRMSERQPANISLNASERHCETDSESDRERWRTVAILARPDSSGISPSLHYPAKILPFSSWGGLSENHWAHADRQHQKMSRLFAFTGFPFPRQTHTFSSQSIFPGRPEVCGDTPSTWVRAWIF